VDDGLLGLIVSGNFIKLEEAWPFVRGRKWKAKLPCHKDVYVAGPEAKKEVVGKSMHVEIWWQQKHMIIAYMIEYREVEGTTRTWYRERVELFYVVFEKVRSSGATMSKKILVILTNVIRSS
jgi:hypothetical protein